MAYRVLLRERTPGRGRKRSTIGLNWTGIHYRAGMRVLCCSPYTHSLLFYEEETTVSSTSYIILSRVSYEAHFTRISSSKERPVACR